MLRLLLDGVEQTPTLVGRGWPDILNELDRRCHDQGRLLASVRFDGVDQPSFREQPVTADELRDFAVVEAESISPREAVDEALDDATEGLRAIIDAAGHLGPAFRGFDVAEANRELGDLARGLGTLVAIVQAVSEATGTSLDRIACSGTTAAEMIDELTKHADAVIAAQTAGDWITVADAIEYDVFPALQRWPELFEYFRVATPDAAGASRE
jgi:hypothetical protein